MKCYKPVTVKIAKEIFKIYFYLLSVYYVLAVLGIKPRALCLLCKVSHPEAICPRDTSSAVVDISVVREIFRFDVSETRPYCIALAGLELTM